MDIQEKNPLILRGQYDRAALALQGGTTLVELLVSMAILMIVMAIATAAYVKLLKAFSTQGKISESYVECISGLDLLRYDIEMAGYGLPFLFSDAIEYHETGLAAPLDALNDAPSTAPRAFAVVAQGRNNADYLAIKSQVAGSSIRIGQKTSLLYYSAGSWKVKQWKNTDLDLSANDRFIVMDGSRTLRVLGPATWSYAFPSGGSWYTDAGGGVIPLPTVATDIYVTYAVAHSDSDLRMPFNRVDYYINAPAKLPARCSPGSFVLYRAPINQSNGRPNPDPVLDCVKDFKVAFGLDTDADGSIDSWQHTLGDLAAAGIRAQLKEVRVFILYQEGKRDPDYSSCTPLHIGDSQINFFSDYTPTGDDTHYRWKILKLAIKPRNL